MEGSGRVQVRTFSELAAADDLSLRFTPLGLSMVGALTPEAAAEFQQSLIAVGDLCADVPDTTRRAYERVRDLHSHGVLLYDAYTVAYDLSALTLELALRDRFLAWHLAAPVSFRNASTQRLEPLKATNWSEVDEALRSKPLHRGTWELDTPTGPVPLPRNVRTLMGWARAMGFIPGRRSKGLDALLQRARNSSGHISYHRVTPVDSAYAIRQLAEIVNQLWGQPTPGGRLFPAGVPREPLVVAWRQSEPGGFELATRDQVTNWTDVAGYTCIVVLASRDDRGVWQFDNWYERTDYPCDLLWGPGDLAQAKAWLTETNPPGDAVSPLDRLFAVRIRDEQVSPAVRPEVAIALPEPEHQGQWMLCRADLPVDAHSHGRHVSGAGCVALGAPAPSPDAPRAQRADNCTVDHLYLGDYHVLVDLLTQQFATAEATLPARVVVPR